MLDFKERFDPSVTSECVELVKDIVAMANSGGGLIVIGVSDNGKASKADVRAVLNLDPAKRLQTKSRATQAYILRTSKYLRLDEIRS